MTPAPLDVRYDAEWDIVHIDDARFAGDFFRRLKGMRGGDRLELVEVHPNKMMLKRIPRNEEN